MKRGLLFSISGLMMAGAFLWIGKATTTKEYYQPRANHAYYNDANGYNEFMKALRANPNTGEVEDADVIAARQKVALMGKSANALGLQWDEMGPTDMGGRTRAILFDQNDPNKMWAGSVSGGVFYSPNAGRSWLVVDDQMANLAVVSLAQASNGDIYAGTGEGMYYAATGQASGGIRGAGIFKSTDGGQTFSQIPSTDPASNPGQGWTAVGKIEVSPSNANRIYAATSDGLKISDDAGNTWTNGISTPGQAQDLQVTSSGTVFAKVGNRIYKSTSGDAGTYTELTIAGVTGTDQNTNILRTFERLRIAVAPSDENYVYVAATGSDRRLNRLYQSKDGGSTWLTLGTGDALIELGRRVIDQAPFAVALAVDPKDRERIVIGGLDVWSWSSDRGWERISTGAGDGLTNPFYVHVDIHEFEWNPHDPDTTELWIGNDGGLFKSENDGFTFTQENKGYGTIQYYRMDVALNGQILGGTQDNGTILIDPTNYVSTGGVRTTTITQPSGIGVDGDGGFTAFSRLDPEVRFKAMQYGRLGRSINEGEEYSYFYTNRMAGRYNAFSFAFADFVTPFALWEDLDDPNSIDSVFFVADTINLSIGFGNGNTRYTGQFVKPQASTEFVDATFYVISGSQELRSDGSGNLTGDGTGTFDAVTGAFVIEFNAPTNLEIRTSVGTQYSAGAILNVTSQTGDLPITYQLDPNGSGLANGDTIYIQDRIQAMFAVGLTSYDNASQPGNKGGGIWLTRNVLSDRTQTPEWWHIATLADEEVPSCMEFSADGDVLYVGTNAGRVYRISNLTNARTEEDADVDIDFLQNPPAPSTAVVEKRVIFQIGSRINGIGIDNEDPNRLLLAVAGYGGGSKLYYTDMALSPTLSGANFSAKDGNLPSMPLYDAVFNYNDPTGGQVIVGTDLGVFTTDDITAGSVTWTQENTGLANVPVFDLLQKRPVRFDLLAPDAYIGAIYAATHGRGIFKTSSTVQLIGNEEHSIIETPAKTGLDIYPNPVVDRLNIPLSLEAKSNLSITIRDMSGKMVRSFNFKGVARDTDRLELNMGGLKNGNYIISLINGQSVQTAKMIVRH